MGATRSSTGGGGGGGGWEPLPAERVDGSHRRAEGLDGSDPFIDGWRAAFSPSSAAVPVPAKIDLPTELLIFIAPTAAELPPKHTRKPNLGI